MGILPKLFKDTKNTEELVAVFDIGSSSVGGSLCYLTDSQKPRIIFSVREKISMDIEIDPNKFLDFMLRALDEVSAKVSTSRLGAPKRIFIVLSSPWYVSQNRVIKLEKNTPFIFNAKLADGLIDKEVKLFEEAHQLQYLENGNKVRTVELKSVKTMLNGYEVADPCNQKAKNLEMTIFVSIAGEEVLFPIENIIAKHFHTTNVKFSSFVVAFFTVVRDMFVHQDDFLLIDIGGEVTDISMVKKNALHESISYPIGVSFIFRELAKNMKTTLAEAEATFSLYKDGHMEESLKKKIEPIIIKVKNDWLHNFQSSLANISNDISIPATIFLTVDKDYADFFTEVIKTEQFNQYTLTESKFQIIVMNNEHLHGVATFEDTVLRDPFLIINAIYINRFLKQNNA